MADPPTVVIGAGIIGVCTAYYLSAYQAPESIQLVETTDRLFASASGLAGGFLARDWFGPDVADLAALSFDQHRALAAALDGRRRWGYVASQPLSYTLPGGAAAGPDEKPEHGEDWLRQGASRSTAAAAAKKKKEKKTTAAVPRPAWFCRPDSDGLRVLDEDGPTAQVDPLQFCHALLAECLARGVRLHQPARAVAVDTDAAGVLSHVRVEVGDESSSSTTSPSTLLLPCTRLVITAGAWTPRVFDQLFPGGSDTLPITSLAGHSLLLRRGQQPDEDAPPQTAADDPPRHALFAAGPGLGFCPEVFERADGSLYLAGLNTAQLPLPARATDAAPAPADVATLLAAGRRVLGWPAADAAADDVATLSVVRAGLCHRPVTPWGRPLVARLADAQLGGVRTRADADGAGGGGVFVAAGHGPWGISMGPGTGLVVAELVQGRPLSASVDGLGFGRL